MPSVPRSNFVLHHWSPLPHETTRARSNSLHASACSVPLRLALEQISSSNFLSSVSTIRSRAGQLVASSALLYRTVPAIFHTDISSHSISIGPASAATTGGSVLTA